MCQRSAESTLSLGQGNMAAYQTAEADLTDAKGIGWSWVEATASGRLFREITAKPSTITSGDAVSNHHGLSRTIRIRRDTPQRSGLGLRASEGRNLLSDDANTRDLDPFDVAATYARNQGNFQIAAQAACSWKSRDVTTADGSASVRHRPPGLRLINALGQQDNGVKRHVRRARSRF